MAEQSKPKEQQSTGEQKPLSGASAVQPPPITISNCSHHCNCGCCVPPKKPTTKKATVSKKAAAVLTSAEIDRMIDLGLGRGIDSTNAKPWMNKSAFQVRRVTAEGVLGTEEGGSLQSYEREVTSVLSHQTDLKASVVVPQAPVQIGIDAEQSRSVSSTRRTVGKKVINRSVSFRSDFSDVPIVKNEAELHSIRSGHYNPRSAAVAPYTPTAHDTAEEDASVADMQNEYLTFEERLSKWITKRILQRQELMAQSMRASNRPVGEPKFVVNESLRTDPRSVFSRFLYSSNEEEKKKIIHDCYDFVTHFRITHYVSSIELGATEYRVFSEMDFNSTIGVGGALAVEKLVNLTISQKRTSRKFKKASDVKTIGKISTDGKVGRGTHDEAVVGIRVEPISMLVKFPFLQLALQRSLVHYMDEQGDSSSGPFIIAAGSERSLRYWSVTDDYAVHATSNPQKASLFFIISNDSGKHPYEFHIAYMGDNRHALKKRVSSLTPLSQKAIQAIPRYLSASVNAFGINYGPLHLHYHVSGRSRLLLFGRVSNAAGPINSGTWTQGRDMFFINCARRRMKRDGYIAIRRHRRRGEDEWITSCLPSRHGHNDRSVLMLFRLLPASHRDEPNILAAEPGNGDKLNIDAVPTPFDDIDDTMSLDEQLQRYSRGSVPDAFRVPPSPLPMPKKTKAKPAPPEESPSGTRGQPRIRFDMSDEDSLTVPESGHHLPLLGDPIQPEIHTEDTSRL